MKLWDKCYRWRAMQRWNSWSVLSHLFVEEVPKECCRCGTPASGRRQRWSQVQWFPFHEHLELGHKSWWEVSNSTTCSTLPRSVLRLPPHPRPLVSHSSSKRNCPGQGILVIAPSGERKIPPQEWLLVAWTNLYQTWIFGVFQRFSVKLWLVFKA